EVSTDMYTSIAAVLDKIEKQILKSKGRVQAKRHRNGNGVVRATSVIEVEEVLGERLPRIVRTNEVAAKPMSVDDAAIAVDESEHDFLVFRNSENDRLNVVYKR